MPTIHLSINVSYDLSVRNFGVGTCIKGCIVIFQYEIICYIQTLIDSLNERYSTEIMLIVGYAFAESQLLK